MTDLNMNTITVTTDLEKYGQSELPVDIILLDGKKGKKAYLRVGDWCYILQCYDDLWAPMDFNLKGALCRFLRLGTMHLKWYILGVPEEKKVLHIRDIVCKNETISFTFAGLIMKSIYHVSMEDYYSKYIIEHSLDCFERLFAFDVEVNNKTGTLVAVSRDEEATCTIIGNISYNDVARDIIFGR